MVLLGTKAHTNRTYGKNTRKTSHAHLTRPLGRCKHCKAVEHMSRQPDKSEGEKKRPKNVVRKEWSITTNFPNAYAAEP